MNAIPATSSVLADSSLVGTGLSRAYTAEIDLWLTGPWEAASALQSARWRAWLLQLLAATAAVISAWGRTSISS